MDPFPDRLCSSKDTLFLINRTTDNASIMRWIPDPDTIPAPCEDTANPVPRPPESPGLSSEDYYPCDLAALRGGGSTSSDDVKGAAEAFIVD